MGVREAVQRLAPSLEDTKTGKTRGKAIIGEGATAVGEGATTFGEGATVQIDYLFGTCASPQGVAATYSCIVR